MKRLKICVTVLYMVFAAEVLGAWNHTPRAREAAAYAESMNTGMILEENRREVHELIAREEYARIRGEEMAGSNEYYAEMNDVEEKAHDRSFKREERRKRRLKKKRQMERNILERIVEAEAGDQDIKGRILVANVIMNRVKSKKFPNSVKSVVFAHRQFSPVTNGRYYSVRVSKKTKTAVKKAMNGKDYSKGALYFMCRSASSASNVSWFDRALTKVKEYGCHEFFK